MKIKVEDLLHGQLHPLFWGMNEMDFVAALPGSNEEIQESKRLKYPMLTFDDIEFYFDGNNYDNLSEIIVQAHWVEPNSSRAYFKFGWINNQLTYIAVKNKLAELGWPFEEQISKYGKSPLLIINHYAVFAFYNNNELTENCELCKIVIRRPE
jgi:hypothetical protein